MLTGQKLWADDLLVAGIIIADLDAFSQFLSRLNQFPTQLLAAEPNRHVYQLASSDRRADGTKVDAPWMGKT